LLLPQVILAEGRAFGNRLSPRLVCPARHPETLLDGITVIEADVSGFDHPEQIKPVDKRYDIKSPRLSDPGRSGQIANVETVDIHIFSGREVPLEGFGLFCYGPVRRLSGNAAVDDREVLEHPVANTIAGMKGVGKRKEDLSMLSLLLGGLPGSFSVLRGAHRSRDLGGRDIAPSRIAPRRHAGLSGLNPVTEQQHGTQQASHHRLTFPLHSGSHLSDSR